MPLPVLTSERLRLRPAVASDSTRLREIIETPEVHRWWPRYDMDLEHIDPVTGATSDQDYVFCIEFEDTVVGHVQFSEEAEPDYRHAGIDIAIHPGWHGRGIGREAIRTLAGYLFEERGHHRITIDPAVANARAVRCYAGAGFKEVGVMRLYERGSDGEWHDGLLMDLLREDPVPV